MIDIKAIRHKADKYNQLHAKYPVLPDEMIALCDEIDKLQKEVEELREILKLKHRNVVL